MKLIHRVLINWESSFREYFMTYRIYRTRKGFIRSPAELRQSIIKRIKINENSEIRFMWPALKMISFMIPC